MNEVIIRQNPRKQSSILVLSLIMIAAGVFSLCQPSTFQKVAGTIAVVFFAACFVIYLVWMLRPKTALVMNEKGFTDSSTLAGVGFVPWEYVKNISETTVAKQKFISVELNEGVELAKLSSTAQKALARANAAAGYQPINISLSTTSANFDETLKTMRKFFETYKTEEAQ